MEANQGHIMRLRTIYSESRRVMAKGNSEVDYQVFDVSSCTDKRIGFARDNWKPKDQDPWRFNRVGCEVTIKARTLSKLITGIENEMEGMNR